MSVVAGIDLGTTSVRVALFNPDGSVRTTGRSALRSHFPRPGWVEQDPEQLVGLPTALLRTTLAEAGLTAADLVAVGIACQRGTFVGWNARTGQPVGPAIGWQDRRTQSRVDELRAMGIPVNTMASCTKIAWLLEENREARKAHSQGDLRVGTLDTWVAWSLAQGATFTTDPSNASATGLYDAATRDWSEPALGLFGIDRSVLPTIVDTTAVVADTSAEILGRPVPLAARAGDQQAACFAHQLGPGDAKLTLGTSAMLNMGLAAEPTPAPPGAYVLPLWRVTTDGVTIEPLCVEGSIAAAGGTVEWLVRMGLLDSVDQLDAVAAKGNGSIGMVPALAGLGTPHDDSAARGMFAGIGLDTTAADLVLGVLDGIALRGAELAAALQVRGPLTVDGGLSRSTVLLQRLADATGQAVIAARDPETTLRGAAALAAKTTNESFVFGQSPLLAPVEPGISPDESAARRQAFAILAHASIADARAVSAL